MTSPSVLHGFRFGRDATLIALLAALVGLMRLVQDMAIAWRFGVSAEVDAFFFLVNLVSWPLVIAMSTLTFLIPPAEAALKARSTIDWLRFRSEALGWTACVSAVIGLTAFVLLFVPTDQEGSRIHAHLPSISGLGTVSAAVGLFVGVTTALLTSWMIASGARSTTLFEAAPPAVLLVFIIAVPTPDGLYLGFSLGLTLHLAVLAWLLKSSGELPRPSMSLGSAAWQVVASVGKALVLGQMAFAAIPVIDQLHAVTLGEGTVATLNYANRLLVGGLSVVALGLQRASMPILASLAVVDPHGARRLAFRWAAAAFAWGCLLSAALWWMATVAVDVLYLRGNFSATQVDQVAHLLRVGGLQAPGYLAGVVLVTLMACLGAHRTIAWVALAGVSVKLVSNALLVEGLGASGLQIGTVALYGATLVMSALFIVSTALQSEHPSGQP